MHIVNWESICKPTSDGGLGIRTLCHTNRALLAKLAWRMLEQPNGLRARVLRRKYSTPLEEPRKGISISHTWRSILFGRTLLKQEKVMQNDNQGWLAKAVPKFPLKEAYCMAAEHVGLEIAQSRAWSKIWKMQGPQRLNLFLWHAWAEKFPTTALLYMRLVVESPICQICGVAVEFGLQALRDCQ